MVVGALLVTASPAAAQEDLPDLQLEDLLQIDAGRVVGASMRTQPATEAPSSVTFITAEDIERFGYRSLADILRAVRGFYVTNDRNFSFLGTRGFGNPGDYNSRVLLLINGHRINDNVFGQAEIGPELGLDPSIFERIEIIRGPGSSLYGDSAFFAVINVITKSGAAIGPGSLIAETGTLGMKGLRGGVGHRFGEGVDLAAAGAFQDTDGVSQLYFPAFDAPETNHGIASGLDGERVRQGYTQLRVKGFTFTGAYGWRERDVPTASFGTLFNPLGAREQTTDRHTLADAEYVRSFLGSGRISGRVSYDRFTYDGTYPIAGEEGSDAPTVGHNGVVGSRLTFGARATHTLPLRQVLTAGAEFVDNTMQRQTQSLTLSDQDVTIFDIANQSTQRAVYADDQVKVTPWLIVNGGLRYDGYERFTRVTPRSGVIVTPSSGQSFKYLYGRAFRAPNEFELNSFQFGEGVTALQPETVATHEMVWERYTNDWLRTSISAYRYRAEQLITLVADPAAFLGTTFINTGRVVARGLEAEAQMRLPRGIQATTSYSLQRAKDTGSGDDLPNSPRHTGVLHASAPTGLRSSILALNVVVVGPRRTLHGTTLATAATADATFTMPLTDTLSLTAGAYNLLDVTYADPASDAHRQDVIPQDGRTLRVGVRLKLGR
jgi:iron complex outermembrane receptor protein